MCVLVGFISALFLAFVCAIGSEQYEGIRDDLPKIDRLQKKTNVQRSPVHPSRCSATSLSMLCKLWFVCECARACVHQDDSEQTLYDGLVIVFGEPFCLRWLLPIPGGALVRKPATVDVTPRVADKPSEAASQKPKAS
jgi:hypothetical protein